MGDVLHESDQEYKVNKHWSRIYKPAKYKDIWRFRSVMHKVGNCYPFVHNAAQIFLSQDRKQ